MSWTDRQYFWAAATFYGFSSLYSIFLWRQGFRRDNHINYALLLFGGVFHTMAMFLRGYSLARCPINNLYEATLFIGWTMVSSYLVVGLWSRLRHLAAFISPILFAISVFALIRALDMQSPKPEIAGPLRSLHAALILLSCGAFGLSAVAGIMYVTQERNLKFNKLRAFASLMPPIQRLEWVVGAMLVAAFILLTLGIIIGSLWLKKLRGVYLQKDPFITWSFLIWLFYLVLLVRHWKFAQRGRRFVWGAIGGFLFIMLTFWGFYLISPLHHR